MRLHNRLEILQSQNKRIRVGLVGAGQMGSYMIAVMDKMKGIELKAVCDLDLKKVKEVLSNYFEAQHIVNLDSSRNFVDDQSVCITNNAIELTKFDSIDVIIEATGNPEVGALVSFFGIKNKKHIVMLSYETVVTIGHILNHLAEMAGVVFTGAAGDEPAAILELYDFAKALGFEIVAAGKGKNNAFNKYATPESVASEASSYGTSSKMHCSFVDGSKTMVEMTAVANATGLIPDKRGMHGPITTIDDLARVFSFKRQGGVLSQTGVVDFALGDIAPGVFVIISTQDPLIIEDLKFERMGDGPNYLLFRPFHLCDIETPLSALLANEFHEASLVPLKVPVAEVFPIAKRDLKPGDILDGFGGTTFYSSMDKYLEVKKENLLPAGIAMGARIKTNVKKDTPITYDMVDLPEDSFLIELRRIQDLMHDKLMM